MQFSVFFIYMFLFGVDYAFIMRYQCDRKRTMYRYDGGSGRGGGTMTMIIVRNRMLMI